MAQDLKTRMSELALGLKDPVTVNPTISITSIPNTSHNHVTRQQSLDNLPEGATVLQPVPAPSQQPPLHDDKPEILWPEPIIKKHTIPRTKSYITLATSVAGNSSTTLVPVDQPPLSPEELPEIDYLQLILQASTRVYDVASETPLQYAKNLSQKVGRDNRIYLKREDLQPVCFSFKCRGAYNKISQLSKEDKKRGVICMSAGNHAQGVALASQKLGIQAVIVMPVSAPEIKVNSVRRLGATVIQYGADLEESKKLGLKLAEEKGFVFIPPYDDPYIIAGQGTCGMEILRQIRRGEQIDAVFMPVGGGGLVAGVAAFIKRVQPNIKIFGVNTVDSVGMTTSLQLGKQTPVASVGLFADGTAVRTVGAETYRICSHLLDDMVLVNNDEICAAIKDVFEDTRSVLEPSGALGVAGIKKFLSERGSHITGGTFVAVTSGANMNFDRLRFVCERSRIGEGKECLLSCKVEEKPGSFMKLYLKILPRSMTEVSYRFSHPSEAHIYLAFEVTRGKQEMQEVIENINHDPAMEALDITENDVAKSHLRFLAGGRTVKNSIKNEKLYRFSFPERPGALKLFLEMLQDTNKLPRSSAWNLTLIHYRNTGGDVARVLIGMDVPKESETSGELAKFLQQFGYSYVDETKNPVYDYFLQ